MWRDVQLEVPAAWKVGYGPMSGGDEVLLCGVGRREESRKPYVGRPGYGSDLCLMQDPDEVTLTGEGLWFGSPLPEGEILAKSGLEQTTVAVGESHVTVATYDEAIRRRVLDSIERVDEDAHGCPARPIPDRTHPIEGYGDALSLAVCVYERDRGSWERFWTTSLPAARADRLVDAVEGADPGQPCTGEAGQLVLLRVSTDDPMGDEPLLRDFAARPSGCASLQQWGLQGQRWLRLDPEMVRPWAVDGVSSYVWSNGIPQPLDRFFRPMWG